MKASRFTEAQIAFGLRQAEEGTAVGDVCRKAGISEATFYNWRKRYAGLCRPRFPSGDGRLAAVNHPADLNDALKSELKNRSGIGGGDNHRG